jgi:hypothetical protein
MLSRFARAAPLRRVVRSNRLFSVISAEGQTEEQLLNQINSVANLDGDETCVVQAAGEDAFNLKPVSDSELIDAIAQQAVSAPQSDSNEGFLDAIGLGPFHRKASLIATGAITAISNEFYVANEETFVALCLFSGFTIMHVLLREPILEAYNTFQKETLNAQTEAEAKHIAACQTLINAQSGGENLADAVRSAFDEKEALVHAEAAAKAIAEKNKVAKDFDARLQALVNRKADEENKAYKVLVDSVYEEVLAAVASDSKFKKDALKYALTAISTPEKAGVNPTVALYESKLSGK